VRQLLVSDDDVDHGDNNDMIMAIMSMGTSEDVIRIRYESTVYKMHHPMNTVMTRRNACMYVYLTTTYSRHHTLVRMETSRTSPFCLERILCEIITSTNPTICRHPLIIPIQMNIS
jgi:hypothetical protein